MPWHDFSHRKTCKCYDNQGDAHYLTFSCFRKQPFLSGRFAPLWLIDSIDAARQKCPFDLWAFVFMPEHVHLLIWPHEGTAISRILAEIKEPVTRTAKAWVRKHKPAFLSRMQDQQPNGKRCDRFWQRGGGYDRDLWSPQEILEKAHYIHANPVRRELVDRAEDWPWSSWRAWEEGIDEPLRIDRDSIPLI
jgi:putative transposase